VNIKHATLEGLKEHIHTMNSTPALDNNGAELSMLNDCGKFSPRNDQNLREMLSIFVSKNNLKFTMFIEIRPFDFAIDLLQTAKTVGVTEVKDEAFYKSIAQNAVQLESALSNRKRKANEMEEDSVFMGKVFGIITDAKEWYFMECSLDDQDRVIKKHRSSSKLAEKSDTVDRA
jgi:hypothetical protein